MTKGHWIRLVTFKCSFKRNNWFYVTMIFLVVESQLNLTFSNFGVFAPCECKIIILKNFAWLLWELELMYVKYFVYGKCSIVTGCIVIITITWNLVTSYECLFSLLSHTWKGASENQNVICKYGPRFSKFFFWFVRPGWIHSPSYLPEWLFHTCLLTLHKPLSLPSLFSLSFFVLLRQ